MSYDPDERRDTPLARKLKERIRSTGPITVADYMQACLHDPEHGYYRKRAAIGAAGDFITAPEISQVFGELVGLWCAVVWQSMGSPQRFNLVELGPGRGTLMRDALRATRIVPGFRNALSVRLIESNEAFRAMQQAALAGDGVPIAWFPEATYLSAPPDAPTIAIANEFLDAFPTAHLVPRSDGWHVRGVALDVAERLIFVEDGAVAFPRSDNDGLPEGIIVESCHAMPMIAWELALLAKRPPVAALFVDYGHSGEHHGETLQAVRQHRYEHPLTSPGEADLTVHVNFAALRDAIRKTEASGGGRLLIDGPVTQAEFLGSLGIVERASRLMSANPARAAEIEAGIARLIAPTGMGSRFKAIGVRSPDVPPLPGFASMPNSR